MFVASKTALTHYIATFFVQREDIEDILQQTSMEALMSRPASRNGSDLLPAGR